MSDVAKRYEWVTGPTLISRPERVEFHAGKGRLERKGATLRFIVGQVRDRELGVVLNWAMRAPANRLQSRLAVDRYAEALPRAEDWARRTMTEADAAIPHGWTFPSFGSPFEQGLVA